MVKKPLFWLALSAGVMLLLPWLVVQFARSDAGMAAVLLLFFCVDPGYCIMAGYYAGKKIGRLWWVPMMSAAAFLTGVWFLFEPGEPAFLIYAAVYFALGMTAMLISGGITAGREKNG